MPHLTPQESFRLGFLLRCAEEGCSTGEIQERVKLATVCMTKSAIGPAGAVGPVAMLLNAAKGAMNPTWNAVKAVGSFPLHATALGIGGAAAAGAAGGYGLAKLQNNDVDPDEAKRQELISAYQLQAMLARQRAQQRSYRRGAPALARLT